MSEQDIRYAGFWIRFSATILDVIFLGIPTSLIMMGIFGSDHLFGEEFLTMMDLYDNLLAGMITILLWVNWNGQTPGKRLLGIKIVTFNKNESLSYSKSFIRYIGYFVSMLVLLIGFIMIGFRSDKRGLHDLMADTCVIHVK